MNSDDRPHVLNDVCISDYKSGGSSSSKRSGRDGERPEADGRQTAAQSLKHVVICYSDLEVEKCAY
jgi:hypothetical protein